MIRTVSITHSPRSWLTASGAPGHARATLLDTDGTVVVAVTRSLADVYTAPIALGRTAGSRGVLALRIEAFGLTDDDRVYVDEVGVLKD